MGNNQSTTNHHNRLSKAKTNTNSPGLTLVNESPDAVSSRYVDLSAKERYQIRESLLSPIESEFGTAMWSTKDEDAIGELAPRTRERPMSVTSRSNTRTNSRSNSLSCFGSRQGSSTKLTELHGSKLSLTSNTQMDLEAAIRLLQEVKRNGSPEDLAALHEALGATPDAGASSAEPTLSRRTSIADGSSLMRRRSLVQTPGVATRNSPVEGRRKTWNSWKAAKLTPEEAAKWAVTPKGITITPANRLSEESCRATSPRAQTPGELAHLGSLQLGTLSIVNGAPSPTPSAKITKLRSHFAADSDYFTAVETSSSPLMMKMTRRRGHAKSKSSVLPGTAPLHNNVPLPEKRERHSLYGPRDPQNFDLLAIVEPTRSLRVTNRTTRPISQDASVYAQDYQADIPDSPFASNTNFGRGATDESFTTEVITTLKEEVAHILAGTVFDAPSTAIETSGSVLFSTAPRISIPEKQAARASYRPMPRTTDSGYSSGGSLRVRSRNGQSTSPTSSLRPSEESVSDEQTPRDSQELGQQIPPEHSIPVQVAAKECRETHSLSRQAARLNTADSNHPPMSPCSVTSESSLDSTSSTTKKRLQKRRPSQPEVPVVQSCQSIPEDTSTIPNIPNNVRTKFSRRLSDTPGMECLTHTFPTKNHVMTADGAESVADTSSSTAVEEVVAPLTELEPEQSAAPRAHARKRSLSLFRRKSAVASPTTDKEDANAALSIVDLGTIASSLGSSPYDAAMSRPLPRPVTSPTHPHQLGGALPRSKSMVSMDSKAAAEFARMRSKDRALAEQEAHPERRRSYHNLKMEVGEAKVSKRRPHHSVDDIPPVPTIDTSRFKVPQAAKPQMEKEVVPKASNLSYSARSHGKEQVVLPMVDSSNQSGHALPRPSVDWEAHSRLWSQRRQTIGEGLHERTGFGEVSASTVNSRSQPQLRDSTAAWGRFSGGLGYNYEGRGVGVNGSAGTRSLHSATSPKSLQWRHQYGVDLSDVPIMLQRA
jgi:hypothetical protein